MVSRIMPYVDRPTNLVPNFGKGNALLFTAGLLAETLRRFTMTKGTDYNRKNISWLQTFKATQSLAISFGGSGSHIRKFVAGPLLFLGFQLPVVHDQIIKFTKPYSFTHYPTLHFTQIEAYRPHLICFVKMVGEVVNIVSKVVGSLATGLVVQKMVTGGPTGKIRFVVSAALLALSAYNVSIYRQIDDE